jgi:Zn-finger nucleic acid-binding protein
MRYAVCPDCNEPLVAFERDGVEIDRCVVCHGTWLDAGELEQIVELAGINSAGVSAALRAAGAGSRGARRCPRCRKHLSVITVGADAARAVELDHCPRGHGLWLDAGEMRAILAAFSANETGAEREISRFLLNLFRHELEGGGEGE